MGMIEGLTMDDISSELGATGRKKANSAPMISRRPSNAQGPLERAGLFVSCAVDQFEELVSSMGFEPMTL